MTIKQPYGQPDGHGGRFGPTFSGQVTASGESFEDNKSYGAAYRVTRKWGFGQQQREAVAYFHIKADADAAAATLNATANPLAETYVSESAG